MKNTNKKARDVVQDALDSIADKQRGRYGVVIQPDGKVGTVHINGDDLIQVYGILGGTRINHVHWGDMLMDVFVNGLAVDRMPYIKPEFPFNRYASIMLLQHLYGAVLLTDNCEIGVEGFHWFKKDDANRVVYMLQRWIESMKDVERERKVSDARANIDQS